MLLAQDHSEIDLQTTLSSALAAGDVELSFRNLDLFWHTLRSTSAPKASVSFRPLMDRVACASLSDAVGRFSGSAFLVSQAALAATA
jgi:hypothetical protein